MNIHRAIRASLAASILLATCLLPFSGASAQEPSVSMRLLAQTPFTTIEEPVLELRVQATNEGDTTLEDLSLGLSIGPLISSREQYEQSLVDGPGSTLICCTAQTIRGSLAPGQHRAFDVRLDMVDGVPVIGDSIDSAVYPAQVDLRSAGVVQAAINTAMIHLVRVPEAPMRLAWWTEVAGPIAFGPDGRLSDRSFEDAMTPAGSLGGQAAALRHIAEDPDLGVPLDIAIQPAVLDQLQRMAEGYERTDGSVVGAGEGPAGDAADVLRSLREVVDGPQIKTTAMPFSAPLLPAMLAGGLAEDLATQRAVGDQIVETILGTVPTTAIERPPSGAIDDATLEDLAARDVGAVLANADSVDRSSQLNDFAPLPAATLASPSGSSLDLVLPDPGVQALLADPDLVSGDPVLAAQVTLGEIATIWREQPVPGPQPDGSATIRGIAVALPRSLPGAMWGPITRRLASAPFLEPLHAQDFVESVHPLQAATSLAAPSVARFSRGYVEGIRDERRDVSAYDSMLVDPSTTPDLLRRDLLYAEAGEYIGVGEILGRRWIDRVNGFTDSVFQRALPTQTQAFTLTSNEGSVPIRMGDPGAIPLTVQIQLRSSQFEFPDGNERTVTLTQPDQIVSFTVRAKTSGTQTIKLRTKAPSGRPLDERNLAVRTTAVNSIAVIITAAAGLVLVGLWCRRYVKRPRS
jgi:Family of unknown function (DUF6049)